jgi:hypothetical protein
MSEQEELQKRIRRNALVLALLALAIYVAYYVIHLTLTAG